MPEGGRRQVVFNDENIQQMFGHEAAEDENPTRLAKYYFKSSVYDRICSDLDLRILVGHKGTGKSALFSVARIEDRARGIFSILIRPDDVHEISTESSDELGSIRNWKEGLLRIIFAKCVNEFGISREPDSKKWIAKGLSFVTTLADVIKQDYVDVEKTKQSLQKSLIENKKIRIYIDDLDRAWNASSQNIHRLSSLLNALRDLVRDFKGLQFRVGFRSDVYFLIRTSDETTDKIEGSVIWLSWTNHDILSMMVKRIQSFLGNELTDDAIQRLDQGGIASYLDPVIVPHFISEGGWNGAPIRRILMSVIRKRPRDLVKLFSMAAQEAYRRSSSRIESCDLDVIFPAYSQGRLQDAFNEYKSELPTIESLLTNMRPTKKELHRQHKFVYTTAEMTEKLKNIISSNSLQFYDTSTPVTPQALIHFMYKIGFITARKGIDGGKIERLHFEENQYVSQLDYTDFGYSWEIHPAYRWALKPDNRDINVLLSEQEEI